MFDVEVIGKCKKKELVEMLSGEILCYLLPRTTRDIDITIEFVKECEDQEAGFCIGDINEACIVIAKNSCGEPYTFAEQMLTLCHELVHAKQFIKGELTNGMIWKGVDMSLLSIDKHPWEKEAFELEKVLFEKYCKQF